MGANEEGTLLPTDYDFAKWLVEMDIDGIITVPRDFLFEVHSANPVGTKNIYELLNSYLKYRKTNSEKQ